MMWALRTDTVCGGQELGEPTSVRLIRLQHPRSVSTFSNLSGARLARACSED